MIDRSGNKVYLVSVWGLMGSQWDGALATRQVPPVPSPKAHEDSSAVVHCWAPPPRSGKNCSITGDACSEGHPGQREQTLTIAASYVFWRKENSVKKAGGMSLTAFYICYISE